MKQAIILFTRIPVPGQTKTRLMPYLSGEECARLHTEFICTAYRACRKTDADVLVFHTPGDDEGILRGILGEELPYFLQEGEDMGERMSGAFAQAFRDGYEKVILIGTDIPRISSRILERAFADLDKNDIVLNPTKDGGYYLIGMKEPHEAVWNVKRYGMGTVFEETMEQLRLAGLTVAAGQKLRDVDTKEDMAELCIHCGKCTKNCLFLRKYGMDLHEFAEHPELAYSCFLCGKCARVCPGKIDGAAIALDMRHDAVEKNGRVPDDSLYKALLWEKNPYKFASYQKGNAKSVLFPGCNFPSFYPHTMKYLECLMKKHGIGVVYDCCGKPVYELGLAADADRNLRKMTDRLKEQGAEELIVLCPNCYHFLKNRTDIPVVTVYRKLVDLGEGRKLPAEGMPIYYPCPDRKNREMFEDIKIFLDGITDNAFDGVQCCGLGGCAAAREPELAKEMQKSAARKMMEQPNGKEHGIYTYCASCISNFRRNKITDSFHVLPMILGVEEKVPTGISSVLNRAKKKVLL